MRVVFRSWLSAGAFLAAAACSGGDAPQVPTALEANSGTSITAAVGTAASVVPAVTLKDATGRGIAGVPVHFTVTGGGTVVNDSVRTSGSGVASSGGWTLGTAAGLQTLTASVAGLSPVTFTAQAAAGAVERLVRITADPQQGIVNAVTANPPSVRAVDHYDNPVAGVTVTFVAVNGSGSITGATKTTDANGVATADAWRLGTTAGQQLARAEAAGVSVPASFSATAAAGAPIKLAIVSGNGGSGMTGASLASFGALPSVRVTDAFDNPVPNVAVTFTPALNSGTVVESTVFTNALGIATVTGWILGSVATQTLVATSADIPGAQVQFTVTASVTLFDITVRYIDGAPSARQQLAVTRAIEKWRSVIVGSSGTSRVVLAAGGCGRTWAPALDEMVTNVLILARIGTIDGVNGVLGNSNTCILHSSSGLPVLGTMFFDSEDLASLEGSGLIDAVILHEMGHVLGIGTQWVRQGLITGRGTTDPIFTGSRALTEFQLLNSSYSGRPVPVENIGGSGTADSHWRESVFRNELMTGYLNNGVNPLSRVTVGSLQDLGYTVLVSAADPFAIATSFSISPFETTIALGNDIADGPPVFTTDKQGRRGVAKTPPN